MLYIVGGCSRSGKSTLAERMRVRHGVPWFPLDALMMGLHHGAAQLGVHPGEDELANADLMWPIVKGALEHLLFDGRDYLVEGVTMRPQTIAGFMSEAEKPIKACFLGYPDVAIETKIAHVFSYKGLPNDWLTRKGEDYARRFLENCRCSSRSFRDDCKTANLPFIDTGGDFLAGLEAAESVLKGR